MIAAAAGLALPDDVADTMLDLRPADRSIRKRALQRLIGGQRPKRVAFDLRVDRRRLKQAWALCELRGPVEEWHNFARELQRSHRSGRLVEIDSPTGVTLRVVIGATWCATMCRILQAVEWRVWRAVVSRSSKVGGHTCVYAFDGGVISAPCDTAYLVAEAIDHAVKWRSRTILGGEGLRVRVGWGLSWAEADRLAVLR